MRTAKVAIGVLGALVAAFAAWALISSAVTPSPSPAAAPTPSATATVAAPPPTPAVDVPVSSSALGAQAQSSPPVRFTAPDTGIDVTVQPVALDGLGRMELVEDPAVAAWYRYGSSPSDATGSTVIAAHVDSLVYDVLPFARLKNVAVGSIVEVTTADGVVHRYAVETVTVTEKQQIDWTAAFDRLGDRRLTIITCGGDFDYEARTYSSNVIVTAVPVG